VLSEADADLVAREPSLPGLATLLDADAFAELLRGLSPAFARAAIQATYVRYKPGTRCLVAFEVRGPGAPLGVYATAYEPGRWAARRADARGVLPGTVAIDARAIRITVFPADARLRALAALGDPAGRALLLRKLAPACPSLHESRVSTLAYKPERRYVGLLRGDGSRAVIKLYADAAFVRARAAVVTPRLSDFLATPRCIGRSRRHRALVLEWLPGTRLSDLFANGDVPVDDLRRAGLALAELHRQLRRDRSPFPVHVPGLAPAARAVEALWPALADRAARLAAATAAALAEPAPVQPIHGDFYAGQVLVGPGRIGILDLDRVCAGDPAADAGNFVAHLEYAAVDGTLTAAARDLAAEVFLEAYQEAGGALVRRRVRAQIAAGLLQLAPRPFRTRAADWAARMSVILDRVGVLLSATVATATPVVCVPRAVPPAHDVLADEAMGLSPEALDPGAVARRLARLPPWRSARRLAVGAIRVVRHKPGRRCLVEYDLELEGVSGAPARMTVIGKVRAKGADRRTFELTRAFWLRRLHAVGAAGVPVPEPFGVVAEWKMWLQAKVDGVTVDALLDQPDAAAVGRRAAEVVSAIQRFGPTPARTHTADDELRILRARLAEVAGLRPEWTARLDALADACTALLASLPPAAARPAHRDFHPGQLLVCGDPAGLEGRASAGRAPAAVHLIDLDLYAAADPALDAGNFLAHVTEWRLRQPGAPGAAACERAMMDRFLELEPGVDRQRLEAYRLVSLARHVSISTRVPDRQPFTGRILECCESDLVRLGMACALTSAGPPAPPA
jgi:aminoglycoside phosphotransferase (APT) family kinase protein